MTRKVYEEGFKLQMVQLVNAGTKQSDVCREYNIPNNTLSQWVLKYSGNKESNVKSELTEQQKEIIELKKRNKELEMERDILKQAALIFGRK